ncbi:MAG: hypothetical protein GTO23_09420 [Nitrososphaeria archaeon]|nr:hypothetical protein [Nitrososphaeria archaeon]
MTMEELEKCLRDKYCTRECPVYNGWLMQAAAGKMQAIYYHDKLNLKPSPHFIDMMYYCTTCKQCDIACDTQAAGINPSQKIIEMRRILAEKYKVPIPPVINYLCNNISRRGNPFGVSHKKKASWATDLGIPSKGETIFFATCFDPLMGYGELLLERTNSFEKIGLNYKKLVGMFGKLQKVGLDQAVFRLSNRNKEYEASLTHAAKILKKLGIEFSYLGSNEPCCGAPFHTYGLHDKFTEHVKGTYDDLKNLGVKRIITLNPVCSTILSDHYPEVIEGFDIEIQHFTEAVAERLEKSGLRPQWGKNTRVVFHDPCYLSRYMKITEEPRKILEHIKGLELVEPSKNRQATACCGAGGLEATHPEEAKAISVKRAKELLETGAEMIVTCCSVCEMMLRTGVKISGSDVEVVNIADVLWKAIS